MPDPWFTQSPVLDGQWTSRGTCRDHDPDLWFAKENTPDADQAVTICKACPVAADCLRYALAVPGLQGIWGATTPRTRTKLRNGTHPSTPQQRRNAA